MAASQSFIAQIKILFEKKKRKLWQNGDFGAFTFIVNRQNGQMFILFKFLCAMFVFPVP